MQIPTYFSEVKDFRVQGRCLHQLGDILGLVLCGTLADCDDFSEIEDFGHDNIDFLKEELGFSWLAMNWKTVLKPVCTSFLVRANICALMAKKCVVPSLRVKNML